MGTEVRTVWYVHAVGNIEVLSASHASLLVGPEALVIVRTATRKGERDSIVFLTPHNVPRVGSPA